MRTVERVGLGNPEAGTRDVRQSRGLEDRYAAVELQGAFTPRQTDADNDSYRSPSAPAFLLS